MKFKAKLRKIGNSIGIYVPREAVGNYQIWDEIEFDAPQVITHSLEETMPLIRKSFNTEMCTKHEGSMKGTCGCK